MPPAPHGHDDLTILYVRELSESIKSVSAILQNLTGELHQNAIDIHKLKSDVAHLCTALDRLSAIITDGTPHRPALLQRLDDVDRELRDLRKHQEQESRNREEDGKARKGFRYAIYVAIITAALGLLDRVVSFVAGRTHPAPHAAAKP